MKTKLFSAVALSIFAAMGCGSSSPETAGTGSSGGGISPNSKPSATQLGCGNDAFIECTRYQYNSNGDEVRSEVCKATCEEWCQNPKINCTQYEYDSKGFVIKEIYGCVGEATSCVQYVNDDHGNHVSRLYCDGTPLDTNICEEYTYDAQGRIATEFEYDCTTQLGTCYTMSYDEEGRIVKKLSSLNSCTAVPTSCWTYKYEGNVKDDYFGDGNCQNMGHAGCHQYYY